MIQGHTIDQTLIELARTMKALKALRAARKAFKHRCIRYGCQMGADIQKGYKGNCIGCGEKLHPVYRPITEHAAATRASMDLTRKLADLRQGR